MDCIHLYCLCLFHVCFSIYIYTHVSVLLHNLEYNHHRDILLYTTSSTMRLYRHLTMMNCQISENTGHTNLKQFVCKTSDIVGEKKTCGKRNADRPSVGMVSKSFPHGKVGMVYSSDWV